MNPQQLLYWIKCNTLATKKEYKIFSVAAGLLDDELTEKDKHCDMFEVSSKPYKVRFANWENSSNVLYALFGSNRCTVQGTSMSLKKWEDI